ncbi:MAG: hypothetical protein OHK0046_34970 [Anaerolineae bacterium]
MFKVIRALVLIVGLVGSVLLTAAISLGQQRHTAVLVTAIQEKGLWYHNVIWIVDLPTGLRVERPIDLEYVASVTIADGGHYGAVMQYGGPDQQRHLFYSYDLLRNRLHPVNIPQEFMTERMNWYASGQPHMMTVLAYDSQDFGGTMTYSIDLQAQRFMARALQRPMNWPATTGQMNITAVAATPQAVQEASYSPDKQWHAYYDAARILRVMHRPSGKVYTPQDTFTDPTTAIEWLRWSPDSQHMLFALNFSPGTTHRSTIYLADAKGAHPRKLMYNGESAVRWSPSGRYAVIVERDTVTTRIGQRFFLVDIEETALPPIYIEGIQPEWDAVEDRLTYVYSKANRTRLTVLWPGRDGRFITRPEDAVLDYAYHRANASN